MFQVKKKVQHEKIIWKSEFPRKIDFEKLIDKINVNLRNRKR